MSAELIATLLTVLMGTFALAIIGGLGSMAAEILRSIARCIEAEGERLRALADVRHEERLAAKDEDMRRESVRAPMGYRAPGS